MATSTLRQVDADNINTPGRSARVSARLESSESRQSTQAPPLDHGVWPVASRARQARKARSNPWQRDPRAQVVPRGDILFPVEVWKLVFEYLHDELDQRQFARVVRFLSALRLEAEGLLYKKPLLTGTTSAVRFAESISQSTHRARAVEALTIQVTPRDIKYKALYHDTLKVILGGVPRLVSFEVRADLWGGPARPCSGSYWQNDISRLLKGKALPLRYIRGIPAVLNKSYAATLRVLSPQLEEVRLLSESPVDTQNGPALATLAGVELPKLHTIACDIAILHQIKDTGNITHLWLIDVLSAQAVNEVVDLLGAQLVSLRIEQTFDDPEGPMYPTERPALRWDRCTRLKFLHVVDVVDYQEYTRWPPSSYYGPTTDRAWLRPLQLSDQPQHLPPVLETLVWDPVWARKVLPADDVDVGLVGQPEHMHRYVLRRFAEATLERFASLKEFFYMWSDEGYFHCMLSPEGDLFEAHIELEDMFYDAWACVPHHSQV
ncbi:hypothetical protein C8T65DRAFT_640917 [Cerioporus squamosus]|nr:hypothetical protein C8T65DRAFT_640917 [Cerioporus squamosus]